MDNRPTSREKNVTNNSRGVQKRGDGLSSSRPAGNTGGRAGSNRPTQQVRPSGGGGSGVTKAVGGGGALLLAIIFALIKMFAGGGSSSGGGTDISVVDSNSVTEGTVVSGNSLNYSDNYIGNIVQNTHSDATDNAGVLNTSIAPGARSKFTTIKGNGQDKITLMVYICGTDLESKHGMATKDIVEMTKATINSNLNIILYTGGCKNWKNNVVSNKKNQIWKIENGGMKCLVENDGDKSMTDPATLTSFIKYCNANFPSNRPCLIMWDHGGGSITGYGYDEKHSGSMTLAKIDKALKEAGVKFDFIGFDACLMATLEAGLTLEPYADYYIASEETEPGVGWYYTNWLTKLASNTSMPTVELGKLIIDDYVAECNRSCNGQKTTLSIVDLAELKSEVPSKLNAFASSMNIKIEHKEYKSISDARYQTREFAQSSKIDHVDLVDLSQRVGSAEGKALASALLSAVKYNRTSSNMSNAYGVSVYFPYRKVNRVDNAVAAYRELGMDTEYTKCIRSFAQVETSGQVSSSGSSDALGSLLGGGSSSNTITTLANAFGFFSNREIPEEEVNEYVAANTFDVSNLQWKNVNGKKVISMPEDQWELVHELTVNMYYDDGEGYIDLGNDSLFEFDDDGNLVGDTEPTWLAIDGQPVAYYYLDTENNDDYYSIMGYVPALLNGSRVEIIIIFDSDHPNGYIAGAREAYSEDQTEAVAKALVQLSAGDKLDFICDYYDYDGNFQDSYYLGEQMTLSELPEISNVPLDGSVRVTYRFTDIYNQTYWTPVL